MAIEINIKNSRDTKTKSGLRLAAATLALVVPADYEFILPQYIVSVNEN